MSSRRAAYWTSISRFIKPFEPINSGWPGFDTSPTTIYSRLVNNAQDAPGWKRRGFLRIGLSTIRFLRKNGGFDYEVGFTRGMSVSIQSPEDHRYVLAHPFKEDVHKEALDYCAELVRLDSNPDRIFTRAFDAAHFVFTRLVSTDYKPRNLCSRGCPDDLREKRDANGVVSMVCPSCGLVASEDLFQADQSERVFEEKKASDALGARRHVQQHGKKRGFQEMETLINSSEKCARFDPHGEHRMIKQVCCIISAVLEKRILSDASLVAKDSVVPSSLGYHAAKKLKGLLCSNRSEEDVDIQRIILNNLARMAVVSMRVYAIFACAVDIFYTGQNAARGRSSRALCSIAAALREHDLEFNNATCPRHLLEDFIDTGSYAYKMKKWQTVVVTKYKTLENAIYKMCPSLTPKVNRHHTLLRVLDGLYLTVFTLPLNEIASAKTAGLYLYRIRARARVLAFWNVIQKGNIDKLCKREPVVLACAIVYEALRNSCSSTRMKHAWPPSILPSMRDFSKDEKSFKDTRVFMTTKTKDFKGLIFDGVTNDLTPDEVDMSATASGLLDELRLYPSYKAECKKLGAPLTETDCSCAFQLKWLVRLFRVQEKRIDEARDALPTVDKQDILADPESILPELPRGAIAALVEKCRTGSQNSATDDELFSGCSLTPLVTSIRGRLVPCARPVATMADVEVPRG